MTAPRIVAGAAVAATLALQVEPRLPLSRPRVGHSGLAMRTVIEQLPASQIREVANAALGRSDVLAFWFGESDDYLGMTVSVAVTRR